MLIELIDEQVDALVIEEMKRIRKYAKQDMQDTTTHPDDMQLAQEVIVASEAIMRYYGESVA